jgi:hypothetical protein
VGRRVVRHGTDAGYQAHKKDRTAPCGPCREAHAAKQAAYRDAHPDYRDASRRLTAARARALTRLGRENPERLAMLVEEEIGRDDE